MHFSKYNYLFYSEKHGYLIYNSLTNSFAEVNEPLYNLLKEIKQDNSKINALDKETLINLTQAKILVNNNEELNQMYKKRFLYYYHIFNYDYLSLTIAPTTACNFACSYCYEEGTVEKTMDNETIDQLIKYVKGFKEIKGLNLVWYGGEPLLVLNKIDRFLNAMETNNIKVLHQVMITNGYLLNKKQQDYIIDKKIDALQITIDGDKESHNERRYLKNGKGTYDTILNNLIEFLKRKHNVRINLRCNIDKENFHVYTSLKKTINNIFPGDKRIRIYPGIIHKEKENNKYRCDVLSREDIAAFHLQEEKVNLENGNYFNFNSFPCGMMNVNSFLVGPRGELYKCWNDIGNNNKIIGYVNEKKSVNSDAYYQYVTGPSIFDSKECINCPLFFVCNGGCKNKRIRNKLENEKNDLCHYKKGHIKEFLELHYENKKLKMKEDVRN